MFSSFVMSWKLLVCIRNSPLRFRGYTNPNVPAGAAVVFCIVSVFFNWLVKKVC